MTTEHHMTAQEARDVERALAVNRQAAAMLQAAVDAAGKRVGVEAGTPLRFDIERCVWIVPVEDAPEEAP